MSDGLQESSVDIPLAPLNQTPANHAGPLGRLKTVKNMIVKHYTPTQGGPERLKAEPRGAFVSLSTDTRDPKTGDPSSIGWSNPELFADMGDQALSICDSVPRVYNGEDAFIAYDTKRVNTSKLSESVFHTSDRTINAPDSAKHSGITCSVWAERINPETTSATLFVGFKSSNGAWVRPPVVIYDPASVGDAAITMARVVADTDGQYFWVVHNSLVTGSGRFTVRLFDLTGRQISTDSTVAKIWTALPGYWDIIAKFGGGVLLAQPNDSSSVGAGGIRTSQYTQTAGVISVVSASDTTVHCNGPLAWIRNKINTNYYLATIGNSEDAGGRLWGYQFNNATPAVQSHEYDFNVFVPGAGRPDPIIGYAIANVGHVPTLVVGYTVLSLTPQTVGPVYDPALRYCQTYSCDYADITTFLRQNDGTRFVSRAFDHDGEWYAFSYYQSGSGLAITEETVNVTWTDGDYMIGQRDQPIDLVTGDYTTGSPKTLTTGSGNLYVSDPLSVQSIAAPDKVEVIIAAGLSGIPDGTQLLKWTLQNLTAIVGINGGRLVVSGSNIPSANEAWEFIYALSAHEFLTELSSVGGSNVVPGNLTTGLVDMISMMTFQLPEIDQVLADNTQKFWTGGSAVVTGGSGTQTFTIAKAYAHNRYPLGGPFFRGIRIVTPGSVTIGSGPYSCVCSPLAANQWAFNNGFFSDVLANPPHKLEVGDDPFDINGNIENNQGEYTITSVPGTQFLNTDGGEIFAQVFQAPLPTVSIHVPLDVDEFTFKLQSLTLDYSYKDALVFVQSGLDSNIGVYKISFVDPVAGYFIAKPADGKTGQRSESFQSDGFQITIFKQNNIQPIFQPKWFITPLFNCETAHVGRFEDGLAFADWCYEGDSFFGPNNFPLHVSSVCDLANGKSVVLPYRARSFTAGQSLVAAPGRVADAAVTIFQSTVGTKEFTLLNESGLDTPVSNELFLPGPLTSVFTSSGFREQGINVAPEAPFMVSQETISDDVHQTPKTSHQIVVTYEVTDENGNRIFCPPSPALDYTLAGTNNCATYGGRLPIPFDSTGTPIVKRYGVSNHRIIGITIYRTSYQDGLPTIQHYKITKDLNVNGLAPISDTNSSGFSFPDEFTWHYKDANPDVTILTSEVLYTDKGFLPRFPATASKFGCVWLNRPWSACYDGSLQFGGDFAEGDAPWFFPGFRYSFGNDKAVSCAPMGSYLIVACENSIWYIPQPSAFPDSSGRNGRLPDPIQLDKIKNGGTGFMLPVDGGVAYSSTVGGIWMITTNFQNVYMSRDIQDQLSADALSPTAMHIDKSNRLHVATGTEQIFTYDQVVGTWYNWELPTVNGKFLALVNDQIAIQDGQRIYQYDPSVHIDDIGGAPSPIAWRIKFAYFDFAGVRRFKHCWAFQILGEYLGPHRLFAKLSYPEDNWQAPTTRFYIPNSSDPYLAEVNPAIEDASTYELELWVDFDGVLDPGLSSAIELISAAVGLESGQAQVNRRLL